MVGVWCSWLIPPSVCYEIIYLYGFFFKPMIFSCGILKTISWRLGGVQMEKLHIHIIVLVNWKYMIALALILPLRSVCKRWCHRDENKALFFFPQQSLDAGWWNPQRYLARMCLFIWWARLVLLVSFDHRTTQLVMGGTYSPHGMYTLNKLDIPSCYNTQRSSSAPWCVW